jgi:hypothetical protein
MSLTSALIDQALALRTRRECYSDFSPIIYLKRAAWEEKEAEVSSQAATER